MEGLEGLVEPVSSLEEEILRLRSSKLCDD